MSDNAIMIVSVVIYASARFAHLFLKPLFGGVFHFYTMTIASIFLDESGDLGWTLTKPRGKGGSSRFIVLAAIVVPNGANKSLERIVRGLYTARSRKSSSELKSTELNGHDRQTFARALVNLKNKNPLFSYHAVVVEKAAVIASLVNNTEVLYNYMAERMLSAPMAGCTRVEFYPDQRTVRPRDKNALHNYLETRLAIDGHIVDIDTIPSDSGAFKEIQAADYLASIVWAKFEENNQLFDTELAGSIVLTKLI